MPKTVIEVDSSIINTYMMCPRKAYFQFIHKVEPFEKEVYFDRGALTHYMLKYHYKILKHNNQAKNGMKIFKYSEIMNIVIRRGERFSLEIDLQPEEVIRALEVYREYATYFEGENWVPIMVEQPFSKVLYEDDDVCILYGGIIDLMCQHGIVDTKTSERRGEPSSLSYQFMGYCWAFDCNTLIVNKVGFQKTVEPKDKFERYTKSYPQELINEWQEEITSVVLDGILPDLLDSKKEQEPLTCQMYKKRNLTSCDKFGGCRYSGVCLTVPELRSWKLENNFKVGQPWEPTKSLDRRQL